MAWHKARYGHRHSASLLDLTPWNWAASAFYRRIVLSVRPLARLMVLALALGLLAPAGLRAEVRIGVIMSGDIPYYREMHEAFRAELSELLGRQEKIEFLVQKPFPNPISWSNAARKLIAFDVDLMVTYGWSATAAVLHEKSAIPLVYAGVHEPEHAALAGPKATGNGFRVPLSSIVRYLKNLKSLQTLGVVYCGFEEDSVQQYEAITALAGRQGILTRQIDIRSRADLEGLKTKKQDAVFITGSSLAHLWINEILALVADQQIPVADILPQPPESEVLMTLSLPPQPQGRQAAAMAARILAGAAPGAMAPQTFRETELVFNQEVARRLGITFPIHLLIEATRVIK